MGVPSCKAPPRRAPTLLESGMLIPIAGTVGGILLVAGCARVVNRFRARNVKVAPMRNKR